MSREQILETYPDETFLFADGWDDAIVGITEDLRIVYNSDKIIELLQKEMDYSEAMEYFYYNIEGAYYGEKTPLYIKTVI